MKLYSAWKKVLNWKKSNCRDRVLYHHSFDLKSLALTTALRSSQSKSEKKDRYLYLLQIIPDLSPFLFYLPAWRKIENIFERMRCEESASFFANLSNISHIGQNNSTFPLQTLIFLMYELYPNLLPLGWLCVHRHVTAASFRDRWSIGIGKYFLISPNWLRIANVHSNRSH